MKKIGSGYASTVYLANCRTSGNQVAIKLYHKNKLSELNYFQVSREIRIHSSLDHKNIIQLVGGKRTRGRGAACTGCTLMWARIHWAAYIQHACTHAIHACAWCGWPGVMLAL